MSLQSRLLRVMLWLLGLAAATGVSTIFLPSGEFMGRLAGTLLSGSVVIGMMMPISRRLGEPATRRGSMLVLSVLVITYMLILLSIWAPLVVGSNVELPMTALAFACCALPAVGSLTLMGKSAGKVAGFAGLVFAAATFVAWMGTVWMEGSLRNLSRHFGETALVLAMFAIPVCLCLYGEREDKRYWRWFGAMAGAVGVMLGVVQVWWFGGEAATTVAYFWIVAAALGGSNVLLRLTLPPGQRWLISATTGMLLASGVLALFVTYMLVDDPNADNLLVRVLAAAVIVTVCGVLAILVLLSFARRTANTEARSLATVKAIAISCPRCERKQDAPVGESRCEGCGLLFLLRVAEPRCHNCTYTLLDIRGDKCPECGEKMVLGGAASWGQMES